MLSPNQIMMSALSFLVCQAKYSSCSLCKAFHASHKNSPYAATSIKRF
jgi:hypothetical protein